MVILQLTDEQAKNLQNILIMTWDEGPYEAGWASKELIELRQLLDSAMVDAFAREQLKPTR